MKDAALKHIKRFRKGRMAVKYFELYNHLTEKFKAARKKGDRVNFHWLRIKAQVLHKK